MKKPVKLLITDDSGLMRNFIRDVFKQASGVEVVGEAENGAQALELIPRLKPDVITLDINMPVMDGLTALKHIMIKNPTPTVMVSTLTRTAAAETFEAFKFGAVDFIHKPSRADDSRWERRRREILKKVIRASMVKIDSIRLLRTGRPGLQMNDTREPAPCEALVCMGASEGGYRALLRIIPELSPDLIAAVVVVLKSESPHVDAFCKYLDAHSRIRVLRARDGMFLEGGTCYLASGEEFVSVYSFFGENSIQVHTRPMSSRGGSIDMLMISAAEVWKENCVGIILSGSGSDSVRGASEILTQKGRVMIQDPEKCLYKETPRLVQKKLPTAQVYSDIDMARIINERF